MTATEVARNLSAVLDQAEHGETITITRGGRRIATITPAARENGAEVIAFFAEHTPLAGFGEDIEAARELLIDGAGAEWDDD
ncbi:type II toxin-antitoxin system prevent-host-death family antitoxin [Nocardia sp. CDC153]|uniref:type II toxin-antitoxin system Phd/YefM family antitoxin n=1 Tax=Nocardia sp. CDC153 TaxID=3112167 RepID=UPI002DBD599E|nr:type II toxin-antitoxin system prevent-host-death family antitoxin [Nocardia sp. CDC153]MEC3957165.1 type II toxin-antitoxin system prevent-host-death family antitoxin [Nocardia sp. CDC153]